MVSKSPSRRISTRYNLLILILLYAIFGQAVGSAARTSITIDEGLHVTSGYTILRTGDFRLVEEHPPLVKLLEALPLMLVPDLPNPTTLPGWESDVATTDSVRLVKATQALIYSYQPIDRLVFAARVPVALLATLLGAVVFRWAQDLWGQEGGALALALLAFDPNILAHAAVAGTDLGAVCFVTLALFGTVRFLRRPTWARLAFAGVTLGLAQGVKLSALILLPVTVALGLLALPRRRWPLLLPMLAIAGLAFWAIYGFELGSIPGVPFPVPASSHTIPWQRLRQHMADGHAAFLLGKNSTQGWWYYFPVAFVLKTPLPTLILLIVTVLVTTGACLRRYTLVNWRTYVKRQGAWTFEAEQGRSKPPQGPSKRLGPLINPGANALLSHSGLSGHSEVFSRLIRFDHPALIAFPLLYALSSLFSNLNIGYRHLLPILPSLFIGIGSLGQYVTNRTGRFRLYVLRVACYVLLAWLTLSTLHIFPHYLAYFNELAGGPDNGYRYLADSNTDWGQAYKDLARFQQTHDVGPVRLSAFIFYDPAIYGVEYEPLTPMRGDTPAVFPSRFNPPPGEYVISATTLDGIPLADPEMYDWFRKHEPDAKIGHVLFYYHVAHQDPAPDWLAQCTVPTPPLPPKAAAEGFGRTDLRTIYFDCTQAWIYPNGGRSAGWYALFRGQETEGVFSSAHKRLARLAYEQKMPRESPSFSIYEWYPEFLDGMMHEIQTNPIEAIPIDWSPRRAETSGTTLIPPVSISNTLSFLGYRLEENRVAPGEVLVVWTYWSVKMPPSSPLSLMAHLLTEEGQVIAVGDGLGVPTESWQPDDVIVQQHRLSVPPETPLGPSWIQTGVYTLADLQRLEILRDGQPVADRILLAQVEVEDR